MADQEEDIALSEGEAALLGWFFEETLPVAVEAGAGDVVKGAGEGGEAWERLAGCLASMLRRRGAAAAPLMSSPAFLAVARVTAAENVAPEGGRPEAVRAAFAMSYVLLAQARAAGGLAALVRLAEHNTSASALLLSVQLREAAAARTPAELGAAVRPLEGERGRVGVPAAPDRCFRWGCSTSTRNGDRKLLRCGRCHRAAYCCKEHQAAAWPLHRLVCGQE